MGLADFFSDLYSSIAPSEVHAEAPDSQSMDEKTSGGSQNSSQNQGTGKETTTQQSGQAGVRGGVSARTPAAGTDEESSAEAEVNKKDYKGAGAGRGEDQEQGHKPGGAGGSSAAGQEGVPDRVKEHQGKDDEDVEEDEEEEPEDPKDQFEEDCRNSKECSGPKHHYDECVERVTGQIDEHGKAHEDCVEEFFHLAHCATQCAAPKLWKALK